ncbi:hypothetical protein EVAR_31833_1 [Eumeta japonica]|uniref:Uncharacterized protein n=1 Tax=Eumeta variegata TaxID=151549 RepID=A0A4C1WLC9_EUMVA|nr:hypothetical protein EVAR_31833_1 [Eumeta japonica]
MIHHFNELDSYFNLNHTCKKKMIRLNRVICVLCTIIYSYNFLTLLPYFLRIDRITSVTRNINEVYIVYVNQKFILELIALVTLVSVLIEFLRCVNAIAEGEYVKLEKASTKAETTVSFISNLTRNRPKEHDQFSKLDVIYYHIYGVMSLFKKIYEFQGQKLVKLKHSFCVTMTRLNFRLASENRSNKYVKELMHVSSLPNVDLNCFGTLSLDMSLIPTMVSISTTYIIVVLQLTHLV